MAFYSLRHTIENERRTGNLSYSKDLAYVAGVVLGDGCVYKMRTNGSYGSATHSWRIELATVDQPFAQAFAEAFARTVKRPEQRRGHVLPPVDRGYKPVYRVSVASKGFGDWWQTVKADADALGPIIDQHPASFLRGIYDSEGSGGKSPRIFSTDPFILGLATRALIVMDMRGDAKLFRAAGEVLTPNGRMSKSKPLYMIAPKPARRFLTEVGSNIPRKQ